ncbi:MAG: hypothetical protein KC620_16360 [Myxococcales bacterium]|nr:hypothetical protein [Myxococcales bacterium]
MRRLAPLSALLPLLVFGGSACIDVYRGAIVQMNIGRDSLPQSGDDDHYELFALINGGPVSIGRFKVLHSIDDCGADPQLTSEIRLVQRYDGPGDQLVDLCVDDRRLGTLDTVNLAAGQLIGGVRLNTGVDLSDVERVFINREPDDDPTEGPGAPVLAANMGPEVAPYDLDCGTNNPTERRGVLRGVFVRAPETTECGGLLGRIAIVPAEDETLF